ncbi:hypothetical protein M2178_000543 [Bradyrhizobium japonicum]|nr:hypothetical protein [Bradyrhizobium japonicum]
MKRIPWSYSREAGLTRIAVDREIESVTLVLLFSGAGLLLSLAAALYWPEVFAGSLGIIP